MKDSTQIKNENLLKAKMKMYEEYAISYPQQLHRIRKENEIHLFTC